MSPMLSNPFKCVYVCTLPSRPSCPPPAAALLFLVHDDGWHVLQERWLPGVSPLTTVHAFLDLVDELKEPDLGHAEEVPPAPLVQRVGVPPYQQVALHLVGRGPHLLSYARYQLIVPQVAVRQAVVRRDVVGVPVLRRERWEIRSISGANFL